MKIFLLMFFAVAGPHLAVWLWYILGGVLSMLKRANLSASATYTKWNNIREYVSEHLPQLGINFLLSTALFWSWWNDPTLLSKLLAYLGVNFEHDIPLNFFTAAIYGVFSDQVMDFIIAKFVSRFQPSAPAPPSKPPDAGA